MSIEQECPIRLDAVPRNDVFLHFDLVRSGNNDLRKCSTALIGKTLVQNSAEPTSLSKVDEESQKYYKKAKCKRTKFLASSRQT